MKTNVWMRVGAVMMLLAVLMSAVCAEDACNPQYTYHWTGKAGASYQSETLKYTIETTLINECKCYITKVWMQEPASQIRKATAEWEVGLLLP